MDKFMLKQFFHELLELSYNDLRPGWGNPCSHLLQVMCVRQEPFLDEIMGDYTNESHEFRLNNAGLKMHWRTRRDGTYHGSDREFKVYISGDQAREYPMFVAQAKLLIAKYKYEHTRSIVRRVGS